MSQSKPRGEQLAPALFPFMAVLLCLIGALVLILALTVTSSHASARDDAEMEYLVVQDENNLALAISEELAKQREEYKKAVELRRADLQYVEDHLKRLQEELQALRSQAESLDQSLELTESDHERKQSEIDALKEEIDSKKKDLANEAERLKNKRPAFSVIPYSGKNGTNRRPIYIECTAKGVIIQPEGILISPRDLLPPGPGNPLAASLRLLRSQYENTDRKYSTSPPPYPLLLVRPDGIEAYVFARQALSSWDDQFGYELIDADMELAFPVGVPGTTEKLNTVIAESKKRQKELLAANPRLAKEFEIANDLWEDGFSPPSSGAGHGSMDAGGGQGASHGSVEMVEGDSKWKMIKAASPYAAGGGLGGGGNGNGNRGVGGEPGAEEKVGTIQGGYPVGAAGATGVSDLAAGSDLNMAVMSATSGASSGANGGGIGPNNGGTLTLGEEPGMSGASEGIAAYGDASSSGSGGNSSVSSGATSGSSRANAFSNQGSSASSTGQFTESLGVDPEQQSAISAIPSANFQFDESQGKNSQRKPDSRNQTSKDTKPIAAAAGKNWAQAKVEGKATPVSRSMHIVAINDRWFLRAEENGKKFDSIIDIDGGPQQVSEQLATAIRSRVDSWGLSVKGGYWVPTVIIESASDAQLSVARLERLLEGSGVELKVVPLQLR